MIQGDPAKAFKYSSVAQKVCNQLQIMGAVSEDVGYAKIDADLLHSLLLSYRREFDKANQMLQVASSTGIEATTRNKIMPLLIKAQILLQQRDFHLSISTAREAQALSHNSQGHQDLLILTYQIMHDGHMGLNQEIEATDVEQRMANTWTRWRSAGANVITK